LRRFLESGSTIPNEVSNVELKGNSMDGNIFNSRGIHVAIVRGQDIFSLRGEKLYDLKGINIYKLSGELVGHLTNVGAADRRLDKATDRLFPAP
jgi:hypothetical protein